MAHHIPGRRESPDAQDAFLAESARLRTIIEHLPVGVGIGTSTGRTLTMNRAALELHGFASEDEMFARLEDYAREFELQRLDGEPLTPDEWPIARALRGDFVRGLEVRLVNRRIGTERIVSYTVIPVDKNRRPSFILVYVMEDLTSTRRAELALRQSERRFRSFANAAPAMLWVTEPDGSCSFISRRWYEHTGLTEDESLGFGWTRATHPDDHERVAASFREAHASRRPFQIAYRLRRADGAYRHALDLGSPREGEDGTFLGFVGNVLDVHEQWIAEHRNLMLVRLDDAIRSLGDPCEIARAGTSLLAEHLELAGCDYWELQTLPGSVAPPTLARSCDTPETTLRDEIGPDGERAVREGRRIVFTGEISGGRSEGTDAQAEAVTGRTLAIPYTRAGHVAAALTLRAPETRQWTSDDIDTALAVAGRCWENIDRVRVTQALRADRERWRLVLASVRDHAIFMLDTRGIITEWGVGAEEVFGYTAAEMVGNTCDAIFTPDDRRRGRPAKELSLAAGEGMAEDTRVHMRKDGSRFFSMGAMEPLRDESGTLRGFVKVVRDITGQKRLADQREAALAAERHAREQSELAGRIKDEFLATLSHELRTPLNAVLGWVHVLRNHGPDAETLAQGLAIIERNARAQTQLIADLLDMSRIISGKMRLDVRAVNMATVIEGATESVRPAAEAKGIRLQNVIDPSAGEVQGDEARLQQVVWNLLSNAVKFTGRGGRVQITLMRTGSHVTVQIADTGQGIAPEFLPHVFERFRQADSSTTREHTGLGLGLAIVKQLVELHGGSVAAESPGRGHGATFTVSLPIAAVRTRPVDPRLALSGVLPPAQVFGGSLDGLAVLVIDDQLDSLQFAKLVLEHAGAVVATSMSVREARATLAHFHANVVLCDIAMPDEDGYAFIAWMRAQTSPVPAAALTAFARPEDQERALAAGYEAHLAKPVDPAALVALVKALARAEGTSSTGHAP